MNDKIFLATCTERDETDSYEFKVKAFHTFSGAEQWINDQIAECVKRENLDPAESIEDWFVKLNGWHHTIQYDILEEYVC